MLRGSSRATFWEEAMKLIRRQLLQVAGAAVAALGVNASSWGAEPNLVGNWKLI